MELKFTDEEYEYLKNFEGRFNTACNADYVSKPDPMALRKIHAIYCGALGIKETLRESCYHCVLRFIREVGRLYYVEKAERERRALSEAVKAEFKAAPAETKTKAAKKPTTNRKKSSTKA